MTGTGGTGWVGKGDGKQMRSRVHMQARTYRSTQPAGRHGGSAARALIWNWY